MGFISLKSGATYHLATTNGLIAKVIQSDDNLYGLVSRAGIECTGSLSVTGDVVIDGDGATDITGIRYIYADRIIGEDDTNTYIRLGGTGHTADEIDWYTGGAHEMQLTSGGDLHVDGDIVAFSSTTSDIRLKKNIRPLSSSLATICKLDGIKFDWKHRDDKDHLGLIAQQVEKYIPEVVHEKKLPFYVSSSVCSSEDGTPETITDKTLYKTVRYEELIPHLIESIKELKSEIDNLKLQLENN